jgi:uncharacterized membrane protein
MKKTKKLSKFKQKIKNFFTIPEEVFEEEPSPQFERQKLFTLTRKNIFIGLFLFLLIVNILVGFDLNIIYLRQILGFLFLIAVPGLVLMLCFKIRDIGFWEYLVYTVGLSISFIMFAGLIVNWTLPALNITDKPLSLYPILICFDIFLIVLGIVAYKRNKDFKSKPFTVPKLDRINNIFFTIPMLFPVLSILGAFLLNNHGPNFLTIIMLGGIAVYVLLLTIFRKRLDKNIWPWAIWMMAISILFASSLRSWYVGGVDNNAEYHIFLLIDNLKSWNPGFYSGTYSSMLSLTIFPSIINIYSPTNASIIFKLFFTIFYSICPILVYYLSQRVTKKKILCFFAAFFFVSQPMFIEWWPAGARQQVALLFFGLTLLVLFSKEISLLSKKILFFIFGISIVVSHYSTAYISIAILFLSYLFILQCFFKYKIKTKFTLTVILVTLLLIFGFLWFIQITPTANGLIDFAKGSVSNIGNIFSEDVQSPGNSLLDQVRISSKKSMNDVINDYFSSNSNFNEASGGFTLPNFYFKSIPGNSQTFLGKNITYNFGGLFELLCKIIFIFGFIYFIYVFKKRKEVELNATLLALYLVVIMVAILPFISVNYDLTRLFEQALFLTSIFSILALLFLCSFLTKKNHIKILILFLILYFIVFSGLAYQIFGGLEVSQKLNNAGLSYGKFYVHKNEVVGSDWLYTNKEKSIQIYSDIHTKGKLELSSKYSTRPIMDILPFFYSHNGYLYSGYKNKIFGVTTVAFRNTIIYYNFPTEFLNENENKIYNNGGSEIFK